MIDSQHDELFEEPNRSIVPKLLAAGAALLITALVFTGYTLLRKRQMQNTAALVPAAVPAPPVPKALVIVDEALLNGGTSLLGGTVRNTSNERLEGLAVELELKRRKDGGLQSQIVALDPPSLEPQQEGRYSLPLKAQDYSSARLAGLKTGSALTALAYTTAQGQKRPPERLQPKTIIVNKPGGKPGEFLNSP